MNKQPTFHTERLLLRPLTLADVRHVEALAASPEVRQYSDPIPPSYAHDGTEAWIEALSQRYLVGQEVVFALVLRETDELIGVVNLGLSARQARGELVYWLGRPYWGCGYATEAARELMRYGFEELSLHRVFAKFIGRNVVSGRVLEKLGMQHEGCLRQHVKRNDCLEDLVMYGMLREEWKARQGR